MLGIYEPEQVIHKMADLACEHVTIDKIINVQSLLATLLLSVAILAFEYNGNKGENSSRQGNSAWRKNALLTQCIKPVQLGIAILGVIVSIFLYGLCEPLFTILSLIFITIQIWRLFRTCCWIYDETKPPANRKYIQKCLSSYVNKLSLTNKNSLDILHDILANGAEELNAPQLIKKCLDTIESTSCSQPTVFHIASLLSQSITNEKIDAFAKDTLAQLVTFSVKYSSDIRMAATAHDIMNALIETGLASPTSHILFSAIWQSAKNEQLNESQAYELVLHISTRCLESEHSEASQASSREWNLPEYILNNYLDNNSADSKLRYAAARGLLDSYISWMRNQIHSYYSAQIDQDESKIKKISQSMDQTTESLFGLTINKTMLGDIMTLSEYRKDHSASQSTEDVGSWAKSERKFLIDDLTNYMDLRLLETHRTQETKPPKHCDEETCAIEQQFYGTAKVLHISGISNTDTTRELTNTVNKLIKKMPKPSKEAANLDRLLHELSIMDKYFKGTR